MLLAARELGDEPFPQLERSGRFHRFRHDAPAAGSQGLQALEKRMPAHCHDLFHREAEADGGALGHNCDAPGPVGAAPLRKVPPLELDPALRRTPQAGQEAQERGFSRTVRSEEPG